ncbi:MAG: hypothetical protein U1F11_06960 [Steroidobacteraceae bacterium]
MLLALLAGCTSLGDRGRGVAPAAAPAPDRNQVQGQALLFYLELLHRYAKAGAAEQAEIFANIRRDYEAGATPSTTLHYALAVAVPGEPGTDLPLAQKLLRQLLSAPETLAPIEHATAFLELQKIDRLLALGSENRRLQAEADRTERERIATLNRRLASETEENARLRRSLEEAQAKLDAIAKIERETTVRKPNGSKP